MTSIKFAAPDLGQAEADAVAEVLESGWLVAGSRLERLERMFADLCGIRHAVGVSSWTTGAYLVLHAWGIGPGDEVIVPSYSFIASANVVRHVGADVVFTDIDPDTWNIDPEDVRRKITPRTKAIMPVDQIGLPCDMDAINAIAAEKGIRVIQDAACSVGSTYKERPVGADAEVTVFSLHARKLVTTGEGGMIVTNDDDLAARLRLLRSQGASISDHARHGAASTRFETYPVVGFNFRLTDIQAAIGVEQMKRLGEMLESRAAIASRYDAAFGQHPHIRLPSLPPGSTSNRQSYMIGLTPDAPISRNELMEGLDACGIPTRRSIMASHLEGAYADQDVSLPVTERCFAQNVLLPMHNRLSEAEQRGVIDAVLGLLGGELAFNARAKRVGAA